MNCITNIVKEKGITNIIIEMKKNMEYIENLKYELKKNSKIIKAYTQKDRWFSSYNLNNNTLVRIEKVKTENGWKYSVFFN